MPFNFTENTEVTDIQTVPEEFRGAYAEEGGKFKLTPQAAAVTKAFDGMSGTLATVRTENDELTAKVKAFKPTDLSPLSAYGTTLDEITAGVESAISEARKKTGNAGAAELEAVRSEMQTAMETAITGRDSTIGTLEAQVVDLMFKADAIAAIGAAKGNPSMLLPMLQGERLVEKGEDGNIRIFVAGPDGKKRFGNDGQPLSFAARIAELKADAQFAGVFESDLGPGGGTPPNGQDPNRFRKPGTEKTSKEKIASGLAARSRRT